MSQTNNSPQPEPVNLALEVSERVLLQDVHLIGCKSELLSFPTEKDNVHEVTGHAIPNVNKEDKTIFIVTHFNLHTANDYGEELARLEADFLLVYKATSLEGLEKANYTEFATYNGVFNAWPYWREFVNNMTARMQLPPLTLQVYRYGEMLSTESILLEKIYKENRTASKKTPSEKAVKKKVISKKVAKKKVKKSSTAKPTKK